MMKRKNSKECEKLLKEFEQDRKQDVEPDNEVQGSEEGAGKDQEWRKRFEEIFHEGNEGQGETFQRNA